MEYLTMKKVVKNLKKWKILYFFSLIIPMVLFFMYTIYAMNYVPEQRRILLNQFDGVYINEDLSKTNVSEGQIKQFAYKQLVKTFTYNYLSFISEEEYEMLIKKEKDEDLPDHRDFIRPSYSDEAHKDVISKLLNSPWMKNMNLNQTQIEVRAPAPPAQVGAYGKTRSLDGRLTQLYDGHIFIHEKSRRGKTKTYKIKYEMTLERKPLFLDNSEKYYFPPLSPPNLFEWRITSLTWKTERRI